MAESTKNPPPFETPTQPLEYGKAAQFKINSDFWINASTIHVDELELLLGPGCVLFTGR